MLDEPSDRRPISATLPAYRADTGYTPPACGTLAAVL
jgi:hypothetical protein